MINNIRLYCWFQFAAGFYAWLPVFFLYFSQHLSLAEVIQLGVVYYFSVCLCEVPSGYFSDKYGRRNTLLLSAVSLLIAYCIYLSSSSFGGFAAGQFFLACGIAMMSGTDTAFLYDSLISADRVEEYADEDARGQKYSFAAAAIASLAGGALGLLDLRFAYVLSLLGALGTLWIVWRFVEPEHHQAEAINTGSIFATIKQCIWHLRDKVLVWLFGVTVLMYCMEHIAYEFYQPYIKLLNIEWIKGDSSSLISGVIIALSMFGGTIGAAYSVRIYKRFGVKTLLFVALAMQMIIIGSLSFTLSGLVLLVVIFRNFPMALIHAPTNATIAPRIGSHLRATYLSLQSLSARLALAILLYGLSLTIDAENQLDWPSLSLVLREALIVGVIGAAIAAIFMPKVTAPKDGL